jgi:hypothetical protein
MSEEIPFKSMKITLSEEAYEKLTILRQGGAFRSDSATIEECIRAVNGMIDDLIFEFDIRKGLNANTDGLGDTITAVNIVKLFVSKLGRFRKIYRTERRSAGT